MDRERITAANFARLSDEIVRENRASFPGETMYFLSHQRRFASDLAIISNIYGSGRILELGGHPFFFTCILKELGFPVVSADLHPIDVAPLLREHKLDVVACDVEKQRLPFDDECFNLVIFNEILEHLRVDPLLALSEANRVLTLGGQLLLTTPNLYFIKNVIKFLLGRGFNDPVQEFGKLRSIGHMGHVREYATREVRRFVEVSGFAVQRHALIQYNYPRNLFGIAAIPLLTLIPAFRGYQVVVARKIGHCPGLSPLWPAMRYSTEVGESRGRS